MQSPAPVQREFVSTGKCDKCCKRFGKSQTKPFNTYLEVGLTSNRPKSQTRGIGIQGAAVHCGDAAERHLPQFKFSLKCTFSRQSFFK